MTQSTHEKDSFAWKFVNYRCSDGSKAGITISIGVMVVIFQSISLFSDRLLCIEEPQKIINETALSAKHHPLDKPISEMAQIEFNSGYWKICRNLASRRKNHSVLARHILANTTCWTVDFFHGPPEDISDKTIGKVTPPLMRRTRISLYLHIVSLAGVIVALLASVFGFYQEDYRSLLSGMIYVIAGIAMTAAGLHYACVVDDEMTPRLRPVATDDKSSYYYRYGWAYFAATFSFLGMQLCAYGNLSLYLGRFQSVSEKIDMVPGLRTRIQNQLASTGVSMFFENIRATALVPAPPQPSHSSRSEGMGHSLAQSVFDSVFHSKDG